MPISYHAFCVDGHRDDVVASRACCLQSIAIGEFFAKQSGPL